MSYKTKYLKYKIKYINLKILNSYKLLGGTLSDKEDTKILDANAQYMLGLKLYNPDMDGYTDHVNAKKRFESAANLGHAKAMYMLGTMLYNGEGGEQNITQAKEMFELAAKQGYDETHDMLKSMNKTLTDEMTTSTPVASAPATTTAIVPSPPVVSGDIANYAYIWFNNSDSSETITEKEKDFIHETITKGTFPTYFKTYTNEEKEELLANEITFVRKQFIKANLSNITILQIPRILYDLFNLLFFYHTHPGQYAKDDEKIIYDCNIYYYDVITKKNKAYENTKDAYDKYTNENIDKCKSKIFELNDRIIAFLKKNVSLDTIDIVDNYNIILDLIMYNISEISVELRKQDSPRIDTPEKKIILYEILDLEKTPASKSILLYRGAKIDLDSTIYMPPELFFGIKTAKTTKMVCSISINLSILSGFLTDETACTINYMTGSMNGVKVNNNKIKYIINKFMFGDGSKEDSLFFIPPIPPYLQLYGERELWHPRTKIGNDALKQMPKGLYCYADFTKEYTYLQSDKTMAQLEEMYQSYKTNGNIATWLKKYIKYKTKYLELKNQLNR